MISRGPEPCKVGGPEFPVAVMVVTVQKNSMKELAGEGEQDEAITSASRYKVLDRRYGGGGIFIEMIGCADSARISVRSAGLETEPNRLRACTVMKYDLPRASCEPCILAIGPAVWASRASKFWSFPQPQTKVAPGAVLTDAVSTAASQSPTEFGPAMYTLGSRGICGKATAALWFKAGTSSAELSGRLVANASTSPGIRVAPYPSVTVRLVCEDHPHAGEAPSCSPHTVRSVEQGNCGAVVA